MHIYNLFQNVMIKDLWKFVRERPQVLTGMLGDGDKYPSPCSSLVLTYFFISYSYVRSFEVASGYAEYS